MRLFVLMISLVVLSSSSCEEMMETATSKEKTEEELGIPAVINTQFANSFKGMFCRYLYFAIARYDSKR